MAGIAGAVGAQDTLTLDQALGLAKSKNGSVRSAYLSVKVADSEVAQSWGKFLPTITPSFTYSDSRHDVMTGVAKSMTEAVTNTSGLVANWQILDSGERYWGLSSSRANLEAVRFQYIQTLRQVLFDVQQQYFDTLRAQELLKVAEGQVKRTSEVLQQTKDFAATGQGAKINIFQADADYQNAKVQALVERNTLSTAAATLKATIGWDKDAALPQLVAFPEPATFAKLDPIEQVIRDGLQARADLQGQRKLVAAERFQVLTAEREATATWSLDATYGHTFSDDVTENKSLTFVISLPWLDGNQSRQIARQAALQWDAARATLVQSERAARADIESAYHALEQNIERVKAAKSALDAAQQNYTATSDSFRLGASTLIDVLTAQVTLETADSNYIQAIYDYYISDVQLKLSTGKPLPGETE